MRAVGIILAGGNSNKMRELTQKRAVAAMPIAGSYRGTCRDGSPGSTRSCVLRAG